MSNSTVPVKLRDVLTLVRHIEKGTKHPDVGFEDAERTLEQLYQSLNRVVMVPREVVESSLWSCVLLNELGLWDGETPLPSLVQKLTPPGTKFNWDVCTWEDKE